MMSTELISDRECKTETEQGHALLALSPGPTLAHHPRPEQTSDVRPDRPGSFSYFKLGLGIRLQTRLTIHSCPKRKGIGAETLLHLLL